jgi:hypothetical protein
MITTIMLFGLLVGLSLTIRLCVRVKSHRNLKIALFVTYGLIAAEASNVYYSATVADSRGAGGTAASWCGHWWPIVLLGLCIFLLLEHLQLLKAKI